MTHNRHLPSSSLALTLPSGMAKPDPAVKSRKPGRSVHRKGEATRLDARGTAARMLPTTSQIEPYRPAGAYRSKWEFKPRGR